MEASESEPPAEGAASRAEDLSFRRRISNTRTAAIDPCVMELRVSRAARAMRGQNRDGIDRDCGRQMKRRSMLIL